MESSNIKDVLGFIIAKTHPGNPAPVPMSKIFRAEEYVKKNLENFDLVTSRAVAGLRILAELSLPALKIGGLLVRLDLPHQNSFLVESDLE